jgi:hypothetical protein
MTAIALTEIVQPLVAANEAASAEATTVNGESVATVAGVPSRPLIAVAVSDGLLLEPQAVDGAGLASVETTPSLNLVVPFAVLQATGAGGNVALPPEGSLEFDEPTPSIELSIPFVSFL